MCSKYYSQTPQAFFGEHSFADINMKMIDMNKAELKKINSISLQPKSIVLKVFSISIGDMNAVETQKGNKLSKKHIQKIKNLNVGQFVIIKNLQTNDTNKVNPVLVGALVIKVVGK